MKELCDVVPILNRKRPKIGLHSRTEPFSRLVQFKASKKVVHW
jgi:hypothetical protein